MRPQRLKYPLLPFSQLVYDSTRWMPQEYMLCMSFRVMDGASKMELWRKAVSAALLNHPVFSMHVDWRGMQTPNPTENILDGQFHRVSFREDGKDLIIQGRINRILGDGTSLAILLEDIHRAYRGESLPLDDYWNYLEYVEQQKQSHHYQESKAWLEQEFGDRTVPVRPNSDSKLWSLRPPKAGIYTEDYSPSHVDIIQFAKAQKLTMEGFFSLCAALAIAEYNGTDSAALTWAYMGREREEERRIFGSLHRDIPFYIKVKGERLKVKGELIREAGNQIRQGIAHSDYPYTLTKPYNKRWNYAVNVLRVENQGELIKLLPGKVELLPTPPSQYAYALLDVEIHESFNQLNLVFRYSASHYKESSIHRFAALMRKYAEWLLEK